MGAPRGARGGCGAPPAVRFAEATGVGCSAAAGGYLSLRCDPANRNCFGAVGNAHPRHAR